LDSLALFSTLNGHTILQISKIYSFATSQLKIQICSVQQQEGNKDYGIFSIATALEICLGNNPELITFDQKQLRTHLLDCFLNKKLLPFPKSSRSETIPRPSKHIHIIDLYCYCHMPEIFDEMMIQCDQCSLWYHCSCVKIKCKSIPSLWCCSKCMKK
jgi:hypothetical protein